MIKIKLIQSDIIKTVSAPVNQSLLETIRSNGFQVPAPCGGNGVCGKCRVQIKGIGNVTSCSYFPEEDIEVYLPGKKESKILTDQYVYAVKAKLDPGKAVSLHKNPYGIAIDIGTTTVAVYFYNLKTGNTIEINGILNPQATYGADVISRIQYCSQPGGLKKLQHEITNLINRQIENFLVRYQIIPDQIVKIAISGNTIMLHLLLAVDPSSIAIAPFTPVFTDWKNPKPEELNLKINPEGIIEIIPSVSGYVGADIVAGIASLDPPSDIKNYLFLDIGTNGEIALVSNNRIYTCATAAGPAFEGANITCGMGSTEGAINTFTDLQNYTTIANSHPRGICGSGLIDIVAYLLKEEIISKDGMLNETFLITKDPEEVFIKQEDIRELQLAKAAIYAGIVSMLKIADIGIDDLDTLFLAGGFGNFINVDNAVVIGLLPAALKNKTISVGNTSGTGASLLLKSDPFKQRINEVVRNTEYIELSGNDDFVLEYAMNMNFPPD